MEARTQGRWPLPSRRSEIPARLDPGFRLLKYFPVVANHLFSIIAIAVLLLAAVCALVDMKIALGLISLVLLAGIALLIFRIMMQRR
jgi:hypothetical protein